MWGRRVVAGLALLGVLTACSSAPAPAPPSPPRPTAPTPPPGPDASVARDVRGFLARPCELLSAEQARGLGLRPNGPTTVGGFGTPPVGCGWFRGGSTSLGQVEVFPAARDLLTEAYRGFLPEPGRSLVPTAVAGLPAVADGPFDGYIRCELTVRTAVDEGFSVRTSQVDLDPGAACAAARSVAESVVATLPPRA